MLGRFARRLRAGDRGRPPPLEVAYLRRACRSPPSASDCKPASTLIHAPWLDLAQKAEDSGFDALYVADHLGVTASPFAALAAAAGVTSTLKLGTYVLNVGIRYPLAIASDAATIDVLSNGRFILGLGAGHTPAEWAMTGRDYPSAAARVGRLVETVDVVTKLLAGEVVTHHGRYVHVDDAFLLTPRPVQDPIPLLIGGNGAQVLRLGGAFRRHREPERNWAGPSKTAIRTRPTGATRRSTNGVAIVHGESPTSAPGARRTRATPRDHRAPRSRPRPGSPTRVRARRPPT